MNYYEVEGRNGYHAIDLYEEGPPSAGGKFIRTIDTFRTRKQAALIAQALRDAYLDGRRYEN